MLGSGGIVNRKTEGRRGIRRQHQAEPGQGRQQHSEGEQEGRRSHKEALHAQPEVQSDAGSEQSEPHGPGEQDEKDRVVHAER